MSDQNNVFNIFDFLGISPRQIVESVISDMFAADYGIVLAVHGQTTVDVQHAVLSVTRAGITAPAKVMPPIQSNGVEILWPSMAGLSITGTVKAGDPVLLIGLRDLLPSTQGLTQAKQPPEFWHYAQQTLKAVPLSGVTQAAVQFGEAGGKAFLRNAAASLFTVLQEFIQGVQGMTCVNGSPPVDTTGKIALALIGLQALMEA